MFSDIVQRFETALNPLYLERDARRKRRQPVIDLVSGNVNQAGFVFPPAILKQALIEGAARAKTYAPHPLGQPVARAAIRAFYKSEGVSIPADQIVLTPGTSLSYLYLFKLLANEDDEILCPTPSYPLLNSIADFCRVKLTTYRLRQASRWEIDFDSLRSAITPRTRSIVLISPHNPTGAVATGEEITELARIAAEHQLPVISDEVFSSFLFTGKKLPRPASHKLPLLFTLNGASKLLALPGMKIGWIGVTGESEPVRTALHALDLISDTFLPINEAAQFALPVLLKKGKVFLKAYAEGIAERARMAMELLKNSPQITFIPPEGGFYVTLNVNPIDEEKAALELLKKTGVLVHPGYFYDLEGSHLVFSFVSQPAALKTCLKLLTDSLHQRA